jgi:hypothetical protein
MNRGRAMFFADVIVFVLNFENTNQITVIIRFRLIIFTSEVITLGWLCE